MNFFKKLFGASGKSDQIKETHQEDELASYKQVPWMTETRLENVSICLNAGFKPASTLPTMFERKLRPTIDIAKRLNGIKALVLWLLVPEDELPNEKILNFVANNALEDLMTEDEKEILKASRGDKELRNAIGWKFENAWSLAWYFGYREPDIYGEMMTGEQMKEILRDYSCPLTDQLESWIESREVVSEQSLIEMEDLFYCLHNAVRSAQLGKNTVPVGFDAMVNGGVIHERRHALTWMLSDGIEWNETDLST